MDSDLYAETIRVPRAVRFPLEVRLPPGFRVSDPASWPHVDGSLEYVGGRLLFTPPSGDVQQDVSLSIAGVLDRWLDSHSDFIAGTNEAGMLLEEEVRAADAAVWRRAGLGPYTGKLRVTPPILAVEVAGLDQNEEDLREKAAWYLAHGVTIVWLVLPEPREVIVLRKESELRCRAGEHLQAQSELPGLTPSVDSFFKRLG